MAKAQSLGDLVCHTAAGWWGGGVSQQNVSGTPSLHPRRRNCVRHAVPAPTTNPIHTHTHALPCYAIP
ncbi:hypothetical protein VTH06DRAFT_7678 [Thermothelomyces fergusii]